MAARSRARNQVEQRERQAKVARLRFVQRWSIEEIAKALGIDEKTVDRDLRAVERGARAWVDRHVLLDINQVVMEATLAYNDRQQRRYQELANIRSGPVTLPSGRDIYVSPAQAAQAKAGLLRDIQEDEREYRKMLLQLGLVDMGDAEEELDLSIDGVDADGDQE